MATTPKLALPLPAGSDVVSRAAYGDALPNAIDANAASQTQADQPFHLDSVTYDGANNRLVCVLGAGRATFPNGLLVSLTSSTFYLNAPAVSTTYFLYLLSNGTFTTTTTGLVLGGGVLLWKLTTASVLTNPTTLVDQRSQLPSASVATTTTTTTGPTYALAQTDAAVLANVASNGVTVTLPAATGTGRQVRLLKLGAANALTLSANAGDTIDESGSANLVLPVGTSNDGRTLCDVAPGLWRVIAGGIVTGASIPVLLGTVTAVDGVSQELSFAGISQAFTSLRLVGKFTWHLNVEGVLQLGVNNDTTASYAFVEAVEQNFDGIGGGANVTSMRVGPGANLVNGNGLSIATIDIPFYSAADCWKGFDVFCSNPFSGGASPYTEHNLGQWQKTAPITSIQLSSNLNVVGSACLMGTGTTFKLYGIP